MTIKAFLLTQGNRFSNRLHSNSQQGVRNELHRGPCAAAAQIKILAGDRAEDWLGRLKKFFVSPREERQCTLFSGRGAARDRRVQKFHSSLATQVVQFARSRGKHRTHLDYCRAATQMSKDTLWIGIDTFDCIIIGKRRQDDVSFCCEFSDAASDRCAVLNQSLGSFATPVVRDHLVAVFEQTFSHAASHVADANKAESGIFFDERVHVTLLPLCFSVECLANSRKL